MLERAVEGGFLCLPAFERDPFLAPLRMTPHWPALLERVRSKQGTLTESFTRAGGRTLLGT
jgi:hypothetical protein